MTKALKTVFNFFASYGFACVILFFLTILTLFGTLEQVELGLYEVQKRYFESMFVVHELFGRVPLLLPGVYLLLVLLLINLVCGAIIRAPKSWRRPGMLIAHGGIIFMIVGGGVTYHYSKSGHMTLYENERSNEFQSYFEYEIVITELEKDEAARRFVIPGEQFIDMTPEDRRVFHAEGLPFELMIEGYAINAAPRPTPPGVAMGVDGVFLEPMPRAQEAERNLPGAYVSIIEEGGSAQQGVLWVVAQEPWVVDVAGGVYAIDLRHKRWKVPFTIVLDEFIRELHPRTQMASNFESKVTMIEGGDSRRIDIKMNEPLRHEGYTFFQASWGPEDAGPNEPLFSTFAVVRNPADQWPLYACIIIAFGFIFHFVQKLVEYLRREQRRRA